MSNRKTVLRNKVVVGMKCVSVRGGWAEFQLKDDDLDEYVAFDGLGSEDFIKGRKYDVSFTLKPEK